MADTFDLMQKDASVKEPPEEVFRATYKRRGSELYISATKDAKVLVTRHKTRANSYEYWVFDHKTIEDNSEGVKAFLESEKYKKVSAGPVNAS